MVTFKHALFFVLIVAGYHAIGQQGLPAAYSGSAKVSYVRISEPQMAIGTPDSLPGRNNRELHQTTHYYDGLGRSLQTVVRKGSLVTGDTARDLVTAQCYDGMGRQSLAYLSFAANNAGGNTAISSGLFKSNPFAQQVSFYNGHLTGQTGETNVGPSSLNWAYAQSQFEASPLLRAERVWQPGVGWIGSGRAQRTIEAVNVAADSVKIIKVTEVAGNWGSYAVTGQYGKGELFKTITIDEHGRASIQFKDKNGFLVLEKRQLTAAIDTGQGSGHSGWQCVYQAYDRMDRLRLVVQPVGVGLLGANSWNINALSGNIIAEQCYRFEYDRRGLQIRKMSPGGVEENFVYDYKNRLVMRQTGAMKAGPSFQWQYTTYDELNRPVSTGRLTSSYTVYGANVTAIAQNAPWPVLANFTYEEHSITHYDDYSGVPGGLPSTAASGTYESAAFTTTYNSHPEFAEPWVTTGIAQGLVTWTQTRVLGSADNIYTVQFYDHKGRQTQIITKYVSGALTRESIQYNFAGKPSRSCVVHQKTGAQNYEVPLLTLYTYDDLGRPLKLEKKFHGRSYQRIWELKYDALGQVKNRDLAQYPGQPSTAAALFAQQLDYNVRNWPLGMNRSYVKDSTISPIHYWGYDLAYDNQQMAVSGVAANYAFKAYDGNIAGMSWKSGGDSRVRRYDLAYDSMGRLLSANFNQFTNNAFSKSAGLDFSMSTAGYDPNGNLLSMNHKGWYNGSSVHIDSLLYTYLPYSNRLKNVLDRANDTATILSDFRTSATYLNSLGGTKTNAASDYSYDIDGNLSTDKNKDLQSITYNHLNLPEQVRIPGKGTMVYVYDAAGVRLKKIVTDSTGGTVRVKTTFYCGDFTYESEITTPAAPTDRSEVLTMIDHEQGRIRFNDSIPAAVWDWFLKDHLGNVRMVMAGELRNDVYPALSFEGTEGSPQVNNQNAFYEDYYGNPINVTTTRTARPGAMGDTVANGHNVHLVRKSTWSIGGTKLLRVMAGDKIHTAIDFYYADTHTPNYASSTLSILVTTMALNLFASPHYSEAFKIQQVPALNDLMANPVLDALVNTAPNNAGANYAPRAYLCVVFFDEQFRFDPTGSMVIPVPYQPGVKGVIDRRALNAVPVKRNGYAMVYYCNQSDNLVYFDNFNLTHERGWLLDEYHYYPFGLSMAGITSSALRESRLPKNKKRFNGGSEIQQEDIKGASLEWYLTDLRPFDAQIGRWNGMDSKPVYRESPYAGMQNNPIRFSDPAGDTIRVAGDIYTQFVVGLNIQRMSKSSEGAKALETLRKSTNTFTIVLGNKSSFVPDKINHAYQKQLVELGHVKSDQFTGGSGGKITFNPAGGFINTTEGVEQRPETDLAHEVGHAVEANAGNDRGGLVKGLDEGEHQASHFENMVRGHLGMGLRLT